MIAWMLLILAGLLEVGWAVGLKATEGWTRPLPSILTASSMVLSFVLLSHALKTLPISIAYAVWVGIGAIGVALVGMLLMGEGVSPLKLACIGLICLGIVGLKFSGGH